MADTVVPGAVISGRYRLERLIGEGGMGSVWAATHVITRKHVALKFLKGTQNEAVLRRFLREARAASAVDHPNVLAVHDVIQLPDGSPVMVMDLLHGESLAERLARVQKIPLAELARILVPVVSAVGTAHTVGIIHRDLKPDNIFLHVRPDGEAEPKVLDFGIAKLSSKEGDAAATAHLTQTGALLGTPYYMSPEQVFGEKDLDQRADVWSMGVILYECLSGKRPVDGDNYGQLFKAIATGSIAPLEQVAPGLPADVTRLVGRMLSPDRDARPHDLREAYATLCRYSSDKAISFGGAAHSPQAIASSPAASVDPAMASAATGIAKEFATSSSGAFSRTSNFTGTSLSLPMRRLWPMVAGIGLLVAGGVIGGVLWMSRSTAATSAPSAQQAAATSASALALPPAPEVLPATAPSVGPAQPEGSAHAEAGPAPHHPEQTAFRHQVAKKHNTLPQPATRSSAAAPHPSATLPGHVVGQVPF